MSILSFLSFKGLKSTRATTRPQRFSRFSFLLPFIFALTIFSATPAPAQAQSTITNPTGQGFFECMPGGFDWGCQVLGYLFEERGLQGGNVFTTQDGNQATANIHPTSVQNALRAMMHFFSNAVLIIASLILLYHFIVMVAETAHTGTIGGKETNQLWAPIRLVVAIGLLVPLSSGMNSGQYITIQIAKWGSGLGSQAWKVFIDAMTDNQTFAISMAPPIRETFVGALKIYTCQEMNNYFVDILNQSTANRYANERVVGTDSALVAGVQTRTFTAGNGKGQQVCGQITYQYPEDSDPANQFMTTNMNNFKTTEQVIQGEAKKIARYFMGQEKIAPLRSTEYLDQLIINYQTKVIQDTLSISRSAGNTKYQEIMQAIQEGADAYGWMSAGSWFLALTRAQGQMIAASNTLPAIREPADTALARLNKDANQAYQEFLNWAATSAKKYPTSTAGQHADIERERPSPAAPGILGAGETVINTVRGIIEWIPGVSWGLKQVLPVGFQEGMEAYSSFIGKSPREAAEFLFKKADQVAAQYDIWQSHGSFDDTQNRPISMGDTANPFAELVSLGHRKLQAGIDLWGTAMLFVAQTIPLQFFASLVPVVGVPAANMMSTIGLGAAALFIFFAIFALMAGVYLAFVIPLMPFIRFFYAIVTWMAAVLEAMICIPFFALAHLTPKGEGFTGPKSKFGYIMLLQILVRPALCIFGLIGALLIFYVSVKFLHVMYYQAVSGLGNFGYREGGSGAIGFVARIIVSIFYVALLYVSANMSFKMIDHLPRRALHWFGDQANEEHYEDAQGTIGNVASSVSGEISGTLANLPNQLGQNARQLRIR